MANFIPKQLRDAFSEGGGGGGTFTFSFSWSYLGEIVAGVYDFAKRGIRSLFTGVALGANVFRSLWDGFFKKLLTKIVLGIVDFIDWVEKHLAPILKFLKKLRALIDRYYKLYIKPVLDMIHRVRRVLALMRLLHIKWADALDRRLAATEHAIAGVFLEIRGNLNRVIDLLNSFSHPSGMIRAVILIAAGRRAAALLIRTLTGLPLSYFFPAEGAGLKAWERFAPVDADYSSSKYNPPASAIAADMFASDYFATPTGNPEWEDEDLDQLDVLGYFAESAPITRHCLTDTLAAQEGEQQFTDFLEHQRGPVDANAELALEVFRMLNPMS